MTISQAIPLLTSIGALLAAVIALFTLIELSKQRKSSYKPDLSLMRNSYDIKQKKMSKLDLALDWIETGSEDSDLPFNTYISVVNIGFGAAKKITAKWTFDQSELINEVNKLAQKTHQSFYVEKEDFRLSIKNKGEDTYVVNGDMSTIEYKYLLPLTHDDQGRKIVIPNSYKMLVSTYLSLATIGKLTFQEIIIPDLNLELNYLDIGKGKHRTTHEIACNLTSMNTKTDGDESLLSYDFTVNLIERS